MKQIAVITGASSGLGAEFAVQIAEKYHYDELWLVARRKDKLEETEKNIHLINENQKTRIFAIDLTGETGVNAFNSILNDEKANAESQNQTFSLGLLVNNAGFGTYGPFDETPVEKEMKMVELNCTTVTGICGVCLPYLQKESVIINTSSLAAFMPLGNFAVYAASKAFVLSFSIALAAELKDKGIKVCAICPGSVSTEFANVASNGARKEVKSGINPKKVVSQGLSWAFKGKKTALYRKKWRFTAFLSKFAGRFFIARYTFKYQKRPYAQNNQ